MKRIELAAYGVPEQVALCVEAPPPGPPGPGQVLFEVLAFPINPADVWFCTGTYRTRPALPAVPGAECVGRVLAVGAAVGHVRPGDLVVNLQRENWQQRRLVAGDDVIPLPPGIDLRQAAMLRINPPTAQLLLEDVVSLRPGEWVVQNVANSAVGRLLIQLAKTRGLRTLNVLRRADLFPELQALGADACLVDGPDLPERARAATGGAPIRLGVEAVGGAATARIAACLADGGTVAHYGSMSGENPAMDKADVIFRGVNLTGFILGRCLARRSLAETRAIYADLAAQVVAGTLRAPVGASFPIEQIGAALVEAQRPGKAGKVLVMPNGMV
jgi:NADPH:quinone reductase-like Zn-dependent oxidoreductase